MKVYPLFVRIEEDMIGDVFTVMEEINYVEKSDKDLIFQNKKTVEQPLANLKPSWRRKEI